MLQTPSSRTKKLLLACLCLSWLASCGTPGPVQKPLEIGRTTVEDLLIAQRYEEDLQWDQARDMYLYLARRSALPEKSAHLQKAALMMYRSGARDEVEAFYDKLGDNDLIEPQLRQKNILLAGVYFDQGKIYQGLGYLPELDEITQPAYKALALNIRSRGVLAIGKPLESAKLRIEITQYLQTELERRRNEEFIWDALNRITEANMIRALSQQQTNAVRGWLELNLIARRSNMVPARIEPWIKQWNDLYAGHEAGEYFVDNLLAESRLIYINPTRIALMLPLEGKLRNVAEAIQNGFLHAYYAEGSDRPILDVINVSDKPEVFLAQYRKTLQTGADFIVGPLHKDLVNVLLLKDGLEVPTLTLNYADDSTRSINNLYQFGLLPEDEAAQIADYALISDQFHALTLTPDTSLGQRLQDAFTQRFEELGGQVVQSSRYPSSDNDYSSAIKSMLNIRDSDSRHAILDRVLGEKTEFIPRRRQDVDMVFIGGNPRQARLIKPQLKFHHASDLPVYATSSISSSTIDTDADRDLEGILYVDMPWILKSDQNEDYQSVASLWPKLSQRYAKFFAMGIDAYRMIPSLRRLMVNRDETLSLNTGSVSVDEYGRVKRELMLATYRKGRGQLLKQSTSSTE
jgi:hypothetical protein